MAEYARDLTPQDLHEILTYNPETGLLYWKPRPREMFERDRFHKAWNTRFAGKQAFDGAEVQGYCKAAILSAPRFIFLEGMMTKSKERLCTVALDDGATFTFYTKDSLLDVVSSIVDSEFDYVGLECCKTEAAGFVRKSDVKMVFFNG